MMWLLRVRRLASLCLVQSVCVCVADTLSHLSVFKEVGWFQYAREKRKKNLNCVRCLYSPSGGWLVAGDPPKEKSEIKTKLDVSVFPGGIVNHSWMYGLYYFYNDQNAPFARTPPPMRGSKEEWWPWV